MDEPTLGFLVSVAAFVGCRLLYTVIKAASSDGAVPYQKSEGKGEDLVEKEKVEETKLRNRGGMQKDGAAAGADAGAKATPPKKARAPVTAARKAIAWICLLHAYAVSTIAMFWLYWNLDLLGEPVALFDCPANPNMLDGGRSLAVAAVGVSCGYMFHDLIAMVENRLFEDAPFYSVHAHHVICIICFGTAIVYSPEKTCALAVCLVCEINTATLHSRRSLIWMGFHPNSWPCTLSDFCTMVTMLPTRQYLHWTVSYSLYVARATIAPFDFWLMVFGLMGLNAIDVILVMDIVRGRMKRNSSYDV